MTIKIKPESLELYRVSMMNNDIDPSKPIEVELPHPNNPGANNHYEVIGKHYFIVKEDCELIKN